MEEGLLPAELVNLTSAVSALNAISDERKGRNRTVYTEPEKIARIQSVRESNAIEGIITTDRRIREIVDGNSAPLNHNEMEIVGYRNALDEIHTSYDQMTINGQTVLHLHQIMMEAAGYENAGRYKTADNLIAGIDEFGRRRVRFTPVPAAETEEAMEQLFLAYIDARDNPRINILLLIPCVVPDFLCIHPFTEGNGRISRLLTILLMYKSGFHICRYVSLEEQISLSKDYYYSALKDSSQGWHANENTYTEFMKNFLSGLYKCYRELDKRFSTVNGKKLKNPKGSNRQYSTVCFRFQKPRSVNIFPM